MIRKDCLVVSSLILLAERLLEERLSQLEQRAAGNGAKIQGVKKDLMMCQERVFNPGKGQIPSIAESVLYMKSLKKGDKKKSDEKNNTSVAAINQNVATQPPRRQSVSRSRRSSICSVNAKPQQKPKPPTKNSERCLVNKVFIPKLPLSLPAGKNQPLPKAEVNKTPALKQNSSDLEIQDWQGSHTSRPSDIDKSRLQSALRRIADTSRDIDKENLASNQPQSISRSQIQTRAEVKNSEKPREILQQVDAVERFVEEYPQQEESDQRASTIRTGSDYLEIFNRRQSFWKDKTKKIESLDGGNLIEKFNAFSTMEWLNDREATDRARFLQEEYGEQAERENESMEAPDLPRRTEETILKRDQAVTFDQRGETILLQGADSVPPSHRQKHSNSRSASPKKKPASPAKVQLKDSKYFGRMTLNTSKQRNSSKPVSSRSNSKNRNSYSGSRDKFIDRPRRSSPGACLKVPSKVLKTQKASTQPIIDQLPAHGSSNQRQWSQCLQNIEKVNQRVLEQNTLDSKIYDRILKERQSGTENVDSSMKKILDTRGELLMRPSDDRSGLLSAHEFESFSKVNSSSKNMQNSQLQKTQRTPLSGHLSKRTISIKEDTSENELLQSANAIFSRFSNSYMD